MASLNAQRHLAGSQAKSAIAMERLSTGLRINTGQDDGAGLAIGSKMGATIRGLNQAVRNANDGISMAKAGDGALSELANMLERMRELVVEKKDGALSSGDIANVNIEMSALGDQIDIIRTNAKFNGKSLVTSASYSFQVGATASESYTLTTTAVAAASALTAATSGGAIESAIDAVSKARAAFGTAMTALEARAANSATLAENLTAARGRIMDADIAQETANMTKASVLQQAGIAVLAQANQTPNMVLALLR